MSMKCVNLVKESDAVDNPPAKEIVRIQKKKDRCSGCFLWWLVLTLLFGVTNIALLLWILFILGVTK